MTQDETLTGGLCVVGIEPVSDSIVLEQAAQARDHDTMQAHLFPSSYLDRVASAKTSTEGEPLRAFAELPLAPLSPPRRAVGSTG